MLEDNDLLHLEKGTYAIYNLRAEGGRDPSFASVSRVLSTLDMEVSFHTNRQCGYGDGTNLLNMTEAILYMELYASNGLANYR